VRALITGAGGFAGSHLVSLLERETDWELLGTVYPHPVEQAHPRPRVWVQNADLRDPGQVAELVTGFQPDYILHLAAQSFVPTSFGDAWDTLENNIRSQLNLLDAARALSSPPRVVVIGSNEEYGKPEPGDLPFTEESPLRPANPYAVSKVTQDLMGLQYHEAYGLDVVRLRPFNHTGPGQSARFVVPAFASQIASIERGKQEPVLRVGNLAASRDFTDVRDMVRAYHLAAVEGQSGEVYNLASGTPRSIQSVLDQLLSLAKVDVKVEVDPDRFRPLDVPIAYGSAEKFSRLTGWTAEIPFGETLRDVLDYWRGPAGD
jgi:GDP-4-dehydro-6-deoxy-D-mannose reductase